MDVTCFLLQPTGKTFQWLRRYKSADCPDHGYHSVMIPIEEGVVDPDGYVRVTNEAELREKYKDQWPTHCSCGFEFLENDYKQIFSRAQYLLPSGEVTSWEDAPIGAMMNAHWMNDSDYAGEDKLSLMVKTPGGDWLIDGRANNCDSPCKNCGVPYKDHNWDNCHAYQDSHPHKCWVRHGSPPFITVDKVGVTCGAGAGSIYFQKSTPQYHGFLREGKLTDCP